MQALRRALPGFAFASSFVVLACSGGSETSQTGNGGQGGGAAGAPGAGDCATICAAQSGLACALGSGCVAACDAGATMSYPNGKNCGDLYQSMIRCEAGLDASQWTCSQTDDNPIPMAGACQDAVCAWACCASSLVADGDVWSRCMPTCPATGTGGGGGAGGGAAGGAGGGAGTGGGSGGAAGSGGAGGGSTGGSGAGGSGGPPTSAATRAICTGDNPIVCHLGGNPGDYAVTVELGGAAAAYTEVQAEMHRLMLKPVVTAAGATQRFSFIVNSRTPEGQPVEDGPTEGTPGLDLYFYGSQNGPGETAAAGGTVAPLLNAIGTAANASRVGVFVAGDSTTCDQTDTDYAGWAQMIPAWFGMPVSVANYADSGESSASFLANGQLWGAIMSRVKAGDWVLIQFGHNDKTDATGAFAGNLTAMVSQAKAKGAHPVLISPPARATFSGSTLTAQFVYAWGSVQPAMQQVATAQNVPYIDLTTTTTAWYNQLGPNGWQAYHALGTDPTHTNRAGALVIAGYVADAIKSQNIGLATYLR